MAFDEFKNKIQKMQDVEMSTLSSLRSPMPAHPSIQQITGPTASSQLPAATSICLPAQNNNGINSSQDLACGFAWIGVLLATILILLFIITIKISV